MSKQKRIDKIVERYGDKIKNINDLTGGKEPSKLFYILARHLDYLLDTDPDVCVKKYGVKIRRTLNPIVKKIAPLFMNSKQVIEDREKLMYPKGRKKKDKDKPRYSKTIELPEEPVIWMANHAFKDDVVATICAAKRHGYLLLGSVPQFYNTFDGIAAFVNGVVMANRKVKASKKASLEKSVRVMEYGADLIMFPEGVWNKSPNQLTLPLWRGAYEIAKQTGAKIVPIVHYIKDPTLTTPKEDNPFHTVVDNPIDVSEMSEKEALEAISEKFSTWHFLMMEKYGQTTREEALAGYESSQEAWDEQLRLRSKTADKYDFEMETKADYRPKEIVLPEDVFSSIADLELTRENAVEVLAARKIVRERKDNDFQRRF